MPNPKPAGPAWPLPLSRDETLAELRQRLVAAEHALEAVLAADLDGGEMVSEYLTDVIEKRRERLSKMEARRVLAWPRPVGIARTSQGR